MVFALGMGVMIGAVVKSSTAPTMGWHMLLERVELNVHKVPDVILQKFQI